VVYDLQVEGEAQPIGVTGTHPFWSPDRNGWVGAGELRLGERLLARNGSTPRVVSLVLRPEPEPVFNLEVEGDHCYRVGEQGLLVHNASVGCVNNRKVNIDYGEFDNWGVEIGVPTPTSEHYFGRPKGVYAFLTPDQLNKGSEADDRLIPPGWNDLPTGLLRARGHLLGNQLGGSGKQPLNIVALHRAANSPAMVTCENRIADALQCQCVEVWITPVYSGNQGAPIAVKIKAQGDRGFQLNVIVQNAASPAVPSRCMI
jgi:hypothetical protein